MCVCVCVCVMSPQPRFTIVVGNRAYSSWSLRAWLCVRRATQGDKRSLVKDIQIDLAGAGSAAAYERLREYSPTGKLPALRDDVEKITVWDSLAIAEYMHDVFPEAQLWPKQRSSRAIARAAAAEMHSSFTDLRSAMPMNTRRRAPGEGKAADEGVDKDIRRVCELWDECHVEARRHDLCANGPFLFGTFTIVDAMFAPVVLRFRTYEPPQLTPFAKEYMQAILDDDDVKEWCALAEKEQHRIDKYE